MLLEVLPSRHEKLPLKEYLLLRTFFYESFSYKTGRKAKGVPTGTTIATEKEVHSTQFSCRMTQSNQTWFLMSHLVQLHLSSFSFLI
jgi:hypothetical protein